MASRWHRQTREPAPEWLGTAKRLLWQEDSATSGNKGKQDARDRNRVAGGQEYGVESFDREHDISKAEAQEADQGARPRPHQAAGNGFRLRDRC
jgi:hypothetical protein